ncbi:5-formyltetrahydrofolate cyclo-ligase [Niallia oryzisoli]|uniref:5-formyltetrahydrofolate cyclo-ligase n=1 Tax=Niallia oryzisoli TaxID=1737571 RepID=UPI003735C0BA
MIDKNAFRKKMKEKLQATPKAFYEHYSYQIAQKLYQDTFWKSAQTIGITISNPPEVDTYQIIRKAWELKKTIVIPKCLPKEKQMDFRILERFDQLESVYYSLLEPIEEQTKRVDPNMIDLLIVPGLAFTEDGYRLGVGGGYYDRFLQNYHGKTLSLAFHVQMVKQLPTEPHDLPVERIITNEGSFFTS